MTPARCNNIFSASHVGSIIILVSPPDACLRRNVKNNIASRNSLMHRPLIAQVAFELFDSQRL